MNLTQVAASQLTGTWNADPVHSNVEFRVRHLGLSWLRGHVNSFDARLETSDTGELVLRGTAHVDSIKMRNEQLMGHLMSPEFFDQQLHPRISFTSTRVELHEDQSAHIEGVLEIRGHEHLINLNGTWEGPAEGMSGERRVALDLSTEIDRHDWGIDWNAPLSGGRTVLGPKVIVAVDMELIET